MPVNGDFWMKEAQILFGILFPLLKSAFSEGAEDGIGLLEVEGGVSWSLPNEQVIDWATHMTSQVAAKITQTSMEAFEAKFPDWASRGAPIDELIEELTPYYEPWRARQVAVTETTRAFAMGNMEAWRGSGLVEGKEWMTAEDSIVDRGDEAQICLTNAAVGVIPLDATFPSGDEAPPGHPECRCWLRPTLTLPSP